MLPVVIDINSSGSGSGRTIISSTTYSFPFKKKNDDGSAATLLDTNLIRNESGEYGIPAASTLFELNFAAPNIQMVPGNPDNKWKDSTFNFYC